MTKYAIGGEKVKKAFINNLESEEKMAATEYEIEVHHDDGEVIELSCVRYAYVDVFEYISDYYENKNDKSVQKILIQAKR